VTDLELSLALRRRRSRFAAFGSTLSCPFSVLHSRATVYVRWQTDATLIASVLYPSAQGWCYAAHWLTETALMQDPYSTIEVLRKFKDMGIQFTLDDFDAANSSLSHLRQFPIDAWKIDRSFVHGLCTHESPLWLRGKLTIFDYITARFADLERNTP
jgi:hypothetical protein